MWVVEGFLAFLFVCSSGLLFSSKFRENKILVAIAGVIALVATYLMTVEIVNRAIDLRLHKAAPVASAAASEHPGNADPHAGSYASLDTGAQAAHRDVVAGAAAYGRKDYANALALLSAPAAHGDLAAQYFVGLMLLKAEGTPADEARGLALLQKAATSGLADAQNYLAAFYRKGQYVRQDYAASMQWSLLAARQNYKNAQYRMALAYRDGLGVGKDNGLAYMWACVAAVDGPPEAIALRAALRKLLSAEEAQTRQADATQWRNSMTTVKPLSIYGLTGASP